MTALLGPLLPSSSGLPVNLSHAYFGWDSSIKFVVSCLQVRLVPLKPVFKQKKRGNVEHVVLVFMKFTGLHALLQVCLSTQFFVNQGFVFIPGHGLWCMMQPLC